MSSLLYKAICNKLLQADFTERINLCCLCLQIAGEKSASVDDEVLLSLQPGRPPEAVKLSQLLRVLLGENFSEQMCILKSVCVQCMISAIAGYKFVECCKSTAEKVATVLENLQQSFDDILPYDKFNCKSLYVVIKPNEISTTSTVKRYYDNVRQFIPHDTALLRFKQIAGMNDQTHESDEDDNQDNNPQDMEINNENITEIDQSLQTLLCCKTNIDTQELLLDPINKPNDYKCKLCKEQFSKSASLRIHFFRVHRNKHSKCVKCSNLQSKGNAKQVNVKTKNVSSKKKQPMIFIDELDSMTTHQLEKDPLMNQDTESIVEYLEFDVPYVDDEQTNDIACVVDPEKSIVVTENQIGTSELTADIVKHKIEKRYECNKCGMKFSTHQRYFTHMQNYQTKCGRFPKGRGEFKCTQCEFTAFYRQEVRRHIRLKHLCELRYVCDYCGKNYYHKTELIVHIRKHTKEKPYTCIDCGATYATESGLKIHSFKHTGQNPYKCEYCGKGFRSASYRWDHTTRFHKRPTLECKICGLTFKFKPDLTQHEERHLNMKMHQKFMVAAQKRKCENQQNPVIVLQVDKDAIQTQIEKFATGDHQYENQETQQNEDTELKAPVEPNKSQIVIDKLDQQCEDEVQEQNVFSSAFNHNKPQVVEDKSIKPYSCKKCGMTFKSRQRYSTHIENYQFKCKRLPRGRGHFKCNQCDFTAFYKRNVKMHIDFVHLGHIKFTCNYCGKNYPVKSQLDIHLRSHTNERPFECGQCGRKFLSEGGYKIHLNTHTGERPYVCEFCGVSSATPSARAEHIKRRHEPPTLPCKFCGRMFKIKADLKRHEARHAKRAS